MFTIEAHRMFDSTVCFCLFPPENLWIMQEIPLRIFRSPHFSQISDRNWFFYVNPYKKFTKVYFSD